MILHKVAFHADVHVVGNFVTILQVEFVRLLNKQFTIFAPINENDMHMYVMYVCNVVNCNGEVRQWDTTTFWYDQHCFLSQHMKLFSIILDMLLNLTFV